MYIYSAFDLVKSIKEWDNFVTSVRHLHASNVSRFTTYFVEGSYSPDEQSKLVHQFVKVKHHMIFSLITWYTLPVVFNGTHHHTSIMVIWRKRCHWVRQWSLGEVRSSCDHIKACFHLSYYHYLLFPSIIHWTAFHCVYNTPQIWRNYIFLFPSCFLVSL